MNSYYSKYRVTLVFCLHELEVMMKQDPLLKELSQYNYEYKDFLRDYFITFLHEFFYVEIENVDEYVKRYKIFVQNSRVFEPMAFNITRYFYSRYLHVIPETIGYCEYRYDYYNNVNSLFYLSVP